MNNDRAALATRWAAQLAGAFKLGGVRHAVISPGSRNTPFVLALHNAGLTTHVVIDERSAGFFALGLARASGTPVVLSCTSGSAGSHWWPAVIEADKSGVPLVLCTADRPPELIDVGAPQSIDQTHLFGHKVRLTRDLGAPHPHAPVGFLSTVVAQALDAATGTRPGPVHLNLPFRKPLWSPEATDTGTPPRRIRTLRGPVRISERAVDQLASRLESSPRGVIVVGHREIARHVLPGAPAREEGTLGTAVHHLAETLGWPVIAEPTSGARFGRWDPTGLIAHADPILRSPIFAAQMVPDLILRIGQDPTNTSVHSWTARHGHRGTVMVDPTGTWQDPHHVADTLVVADPAWLCEALAARIPERTASVGWFETWLRAERLASQILGHHLHSGQWEGRIAAEVVRAIPDGGWLHVASSMPIRDLDAFAGSRTAQLTVAASRGANGIDGTLATALGEAQVASPLVVLTGDLAAVHDLGSLRMCAQHRGTFVIVVVDNSGGGIFQHLPISQHPDGFERYFITDPQADIPALAHASGLTVHTSHDVGAVGPLLRQALKHGGAHLIHIRVARETSFALRSDALAAVRLAVDADVSEVVR